jgi:hypothetical protein
MSLSGVSSGSCTNAVGQYGNTYQSSSTTRQSTVDSTRPSGPPPGGGLIDAIMQSLSQIGVGQTSATDNSDTSTSSDSSTTAQNAVQAFGDFMQNLMAALHSQNAGGAQGGQPPSGQPPGAGNGGGPGQLGSDLESLISELTSSDSSTSSTDSTSDSTSDSSTSDTSLSGLEQSFSTLLNALGGSSGTTTLESFLEALASKLQSNGPSGNVINTQA